MKLPPNHPSQTPEDMPQNNETEQSNTDTMHGNEPSDTNHNHYSDNVDVTAEPDPNATQPSTLLVKAPRGMLGQEVSWLECDDDDISTLTQSQFDDIISHNGLCTPYILFYQKRQATR